ncbi:MAG TPA: ATP-NAD kinase [Candidatus Korarchaeota archaeon]|nr:ATP-NAD kinase [Candidatus Korarchaeota archaeon]
MRPVFNADAAAIKLVKKLLGFIVNPIAGLGGPAGFKGTDDPEIVRLALEMGFEPVSPRRARRAIRSLVSRISDIPVVSPRGEMGEEELRAEGVGPSEILEIPKGSTSTAEDTKKAAAEMLQRGVNLILFCGGDGTAADIASVVGEKVPILGIPAGVKMFSGVFAYSPEEAGSLAADFLQGKVGVRLAEILDAEEESYRAGRLSLALRGYALTPDDPTRIQLSKQPTPASEKETIRGIAKYVSELLSDDTLYILGPGSTVLLVARELGINKTPLGVDVSLGRRLLAKDVNARELEQLVVRHKGPIKLVLSPVGGSGVLLGRGNQQISRRVLERLSRDDLIVVSAPSKIANLRELRLDLDEDVKEKFVGYIRVITGYREETVIRIR